MQIYLKAFYASASAALAAASSAYVAGHGHIGWLAGLTIAGAAVGAFGVVWGVPNKGA